MYKIDFENINRCWFDNDYRGGYDWSWG